ncbi:uncharacterized protein LOC111877622 [Lactuca sativa]|uniref:Reverse transcriptase zinc-binding domain-containing protein n=1 Tax=Lactuca sativa TaxID=4236 RepID=A0A9R1W666_LACSA|nr:uncharacterized protein LOC111877622 [Lactuca sativa]KAJ0219256.1 hypothetical protein LSAT_V11C300102260 [Lactuca sativa]
MALVKRGVQVHSTQCSACISGLESTDHLFLRCPFAVDLWNRLWNWCGITPMIFSSIKEMLNYIATTGQCPKRRTTLLSIICGALWGMWRARIDRIFNSKLNSPELVFEGVRALVHAWIKHRHRKGNFVWGNGLNLLSTLCNL